MRASSDRIVVLIPARDAACSVGDVVRGVRSFLPEVWVADDGSVDRTATEAALAGARVLRWSRGLGKGEALRRLIAQAMKLGFDAVVTMDADGQHDPQDLPSLLAAHAQQPDKWVMGQREMASVSVPRARGWAARWAAAAIHRQVGWSPPDSQCGYRLIPSQLIPDPMPTGEGFVMETQWLLDAIQRGQKPILVPVRTIYQPSGMSHFKAIADTFRIACCIARWPAMTQVP